MKPTHIICLFLLFSICFFSFSCRHVSVGKQLKEETYTEQASIDRIKTEMKNATIKMVPEGSHVSFIFLSKDEIIKSINSFLLE